MVLPPPSRPPLPVLLVWGSLAVAEAMALVNGHWSLAFVAVATFALTLVPMVVSRRIGIRLPVAFVVGSTLFIYATIFLGEAFDFYNRIWWWDIALHGGSALGFGMIGFAFAFMLFEGERYAAPAWALALFGFTVAVSIGALWEIFEFGMDQTFGTNMQKSGLRDTMGDLILDVIGGAVGAVSGFLYLKELGFTAFATFLGRYVEVKRQKRRVVRRARRP
jgi:hypothetical protein